MRWEYRERFPRHRLQMKPPVSDPGMPGSLPRGGGENVPGIPGACATRNFMYLVRGPCMIYFPPLLLLCCMQYHVMLGYDIQYVLQYHCMLIHGFPMHTARILICVIGLQADVLRHQCWQGYDINVLHIEPQIFVFLASWRFMVMMDVRYLYWC